jgi:hypothetical protein
MDRQVFVGKDTKPLRGLADLPSYSILDRGRLVGLWEYDTSTNSITWWLAIPKKDKALRDAVARTESYVREPLANGRSFSLDRPKTRAPRVQALHRATHGAQ